MRVLLRKWLKTLRKLTEDGREVYVHESASTEAPRPIKTVADIPEPK